MIQGIQTDHVLTELNPLERKNAPEKLFLEGDISLLTEGRRVSVVGSRKVSEPGIRLTEVLAEALVRHNFVVVSGLAEGVDTFAHETAIRCGGKTIAVLGAPLDKVYPAKNKALLDKIKQEHLAVSQFPLNYPIKAENFPRRNRTMALISDATVIVEASEKSGTRHQGWEALRLGRRVFIMENILQDLDLTWPKEMISYGAQVLTLEDISEVLEDIPSFTAGGAVAF